MGFGVSCLEKGMYKIAYCEKKANVKLQSVEMGKRKDAKFAFAREQQEGPGLLALPAR